VRAIALLLLAAGMLAALGGCEAIVETDQARLCRIALPALWPEADRFLNLKETEFADGRGLRIDFSTEPSSVEANPYIACHFNAPGRPRRAEDLVGVVTSHGPPMGDVALYMLQRFWLGTPEGRAADPAPLGDISGAIPLPPVLAYALQQLLDGLPLACVYALVAAAYSLIYGLVGRINLAFGAFAAVGGYTLTIGAALIGPEWPFALAALGAAVAAAAAAAWGNAASRLVFEPLRGASGQQNLVASVGVALALSEFLRINTGTREAWVGPMFDQPTAIARAGDFLVTFTPIALVAGVAALASAFGLVALMRATEFGRRWRAFSDDPLAAELCGLSPQATYRQSFALACALAGLAGGVMTLAYGAVGYAAGFGIGLKALVAAVAGGIGSIEGALLGGLLVGLGQALWSGYFAADYRDVALFTALVMLLTLRPAGLFGGSDAGQTFRPHLNR
jgi:branched-chain amino acid transport system permease protein